MAGHDDTHPRARDEDGARGSRIAFERLRERTDELELIISGLLAFALLAVPGQIFDRWAVTDIHIEGMLAQALQFGFLAGAGLCYSLAFAFIIHLAIRGYWIALIGLKSTFPDGIRWDRLPMMGEIAQAYYRTRIADLGSAIDRTDRVASMLFAMAILLALAMVWVGVVAVVMMLAASIIGSLFGDGDGAAWRILVISYVIFLVASMLPWLSEKYVLRRQRDGRESPRIVRFVHAVLRAYGVIMPQRLILPVQATLQSNLPGHGFMVVYALLIMLAMAFGSMQLVNSRAFSLFNHYRVLTGEAVQHGLASAHYESMRSGHDVLLRYPMIPSDQIASTHLRLFIPHRPQRDNPLTRQRCPMLANGRNEAKDEAAAELALQCLARLWSVTLDGTPVPLDDFLPAERRDIELRGLLGYIDISGLAPGRHDLHLVWNPGGGDPGSLREVHYRIPFWFTPGIEQSASQ